MGAKQSANRQQKLASISAASMAHRDTPLIRNAWYVAAKAAKSHGIFFPTVPWYQHSSFQEGRWYSGGLTEPLLSPFFSPVRR